MYSTTVLFWIEKSARTTAFVRDVASYLQDNMR